MKYGLTRRIDVYDYEKGCGETVIAPAASWFKATNWISAHKEELDGLGAAAGAYESHVWAYYGLADANKADKYGLSEPKSLDDVVAMASKVSLSMEPVSEDSLPLARAHAKS